MILFAIHWLVILLHCAAPVVALLLIKNHGERATSLLLRCLAATLLAALAAATYSMLEHGRCSIPQFLFAAYFAFSVLIILGWIDDATRRLLRKCFRRRSMVWAGRWVILIAVGGPYLFAAAAVYRPRIVSRGNPSTAWHAKFTRVGFKTNDGISIAAWWIPAAQPRTDIPPTTALICPGIAGSRDAYSVIVRTLINGGYNVLIFDSRASGESGGQLYSFGNLESRDVLAAIAWLKANNAPSIKRIVGVGFDSGAAALITAAASSQGAAIESLALYAGFDKTSLLARDIARENFHPPFDWLVQHISVPIASAMCGANLSEFNPDAMIDSIWPRPILFIHGVRDQLIPFDRGRALFDATSFPKQCIWLPSENHNEAIRDSDAANAVREFFDTARPFPAI